MLKTRCVIAVLCLAALLAPRTISSAPLPAPKLVVVIVVDQMRADYVDRFQHQWTAGLRRLVDHGAWFSRAAYPYFNTITCGGHATISTGVVQAVHGMILNEWFDRASGKLVACTDDETAPLLMYGGPGPAIGRGPGRLAAPTFTDEMRAQLGVTPRIVTLSLKPRSAISLAGRRPDVSLWVEDGVWATSKAYAKTPTPWVEQYVAAHPIARELGQTWTRLAPEASYYYSDHDAFERPPTGWTDIFPHVLAGVNGAVDEQFYDLWERSPFSDEYLAQLASTAVDAMKLGQGPSTDYLGVSFSALDLVGHKFGSRSHETQDVLRRLDRTLGALLDHLDKTVGADKYVVALSADHGSAPVPEMAVRDGLDAGRVSTNDIGARAQKTLEQVWGPGKYVARQQYTETYFQPGVYDRLVAEPATLQKVIDAMRSSPGVARVFRSEDLAGRRGSSDPIERAAALSYFPGRSGDLFVVNKPYWITSADAATHGTAYAYDQRVPVILYGAAVRPGQYLNDASPVDIAPTLASLCGITLARTDGRVLQEALILRRETNDARKEE